MLASPVGGPGGRAGDREPSAPPARGKTAAGRCCRTSGSSWPTRFRAAPTATPQLGGMGAFPGPRRWGVPPPAWSGSGRRLAGVLQNRSCPRVRCRLGSVGPVRASAAAVGGLGSLLGGRARTRSSRYVVDKSSMTAPTTSLPTTSIVRKVTDTRRRRARLFDARPSVLRFAIPCIHVLRASPVRTRIEPTLSTNLTCSSCAAYRRTRVNSIGQLSPSESVATVGPKQLRST